MAEAAAFADDPSLRLLADGGPLGRMLTLGGGEEAVLLTGGWRRGGRGAIDQGNRRKRGSHG